MATKTDPPFSDLSDYACALAELVPDKKSAREDSSFIQDAVRHFSDDVPRPMTADIGDGSMREWTLGSSPFAEWTFGFSEQRTVRVERLSGDEPTNPPDWLRDDDSEYWIRVEEESGSEVLYLMFADAPPASDDQVRVHWDRVWTVSASENEVRENHQMAVVYAAAALKCEALASAYSNTRLDSTDLFDGSSKIEELKNLATSFWAKYRRKLKSDRHRLSHTQVRTGRMPVFRRGWRV